MSLVSFVKARGESTPAIKRAILDSLDLIQYSFPKNVRNVVIKPNMCYYWDYTTGQTTHPEFVASLIEAVRDSISQNVNIFIVESDASAMRCKYAFKILGYEKMAQKYSVKLVNLSEDKGERVEVSIGEQRFWYMLPQTIRNADLRINVPKIKSMPYTKISCSLKNIFGCNPNQTKFKCHPRLDENIVALNKIMKFNLCILDGIILAGSQPRKIGLVMASQDSVALDSAAAKIVGVNPKSVRHIVLANKEGLGNILFIPRGTDPKLFEKTYMRKRPIEKVMSSAYTIATRVGLLKTDIL